MSNDSSDRSGSANRQDKLFTAAFYWHFKFCFPNSVHGHCRVCGFGLFFLFCGWLFFFLSWALSALENLPVALNRISKQNSLCRISFPPDPFLFITFIFSSILRSEATGSSVFSGSAHKTSLPCSHASTRTKPTSANIHPSPHKAHAGNSVHEFKAFSK